MGIVIIILLILLAGVGLYFLFKTLKWVFIKRVRVVAMPLLLMSIVLGIVIYQQFFVKMEFVQSNIYPDLYLIKKPDKDKIVVNKAIKEKVIQLTDNQFRNKQVSKEIESYTLRFYEYSKGDWGENGTAYFIDNTERRDGMTAELLEYYPEYLLAEFSLQYCNKTSNNIGILNYFKDSKRVKIDTLKKLELNKTK